MARLTAEQWHHLLAEQANSGVSVAEFCQLRQLSTKTFYARRRRLAKAGKQEAPPSSSAFIPLRSSSAGPSTICLEVGSVNLHLSQPCDPQWLATLLKALTP